MQSKLLAVYLLLFVTHRSVLSADLARIKYNNPGLTVDLGVGLWASPMPMDYDGDGDLDLVVSCDDKPYNGLYFFENTQGNVRLPIFKPAVRIGDGVRNVQVSYTEAGPRVLSPGKEYQDFRKDQLSNVKQIAPFSLGFEILESIKPGFDRAGVKMYQPNYGRAANVRANQWKYCDYNGDGLLDLVIGVGDWNDYGMEWKGTGWENGYNADGKWTRGPLRGVVYVAINKGTHEKPSYKKPDRIMIGEAQLEVFGMPSPNFADFDGDGDLDLLCGEFKDTLTYFENVGSRKKPEYAKGRTVSIGSKPLKMDLCMIVPVVIDWDQDGDLDVVVGEEDGRVALVENRGGMKDGTPNFAHPVFFEQEADEVKFGALATPVSFDWDGDGDEDLICGNSAGYLGFIENLDGKKNPKWAEPVYLKAGGEVIRIQAGYNGIVQGTSEAKWGYTTLSVADWNDDKLPDLVVNSSWGKVVWFQNVGTIGAPELLPEKPVRVLWEKEPPKPGWTWWKPGPEELATQWRTTPVVVDWNRDGKNDLIMLDSEGYLAYFEKEMRDGVPYLLPPRRIYSTPENSVYNNNHEPIETSAGLLRLNGDRAGRSGRRKLALVDWDQDGDLDLFVNSYLNANYMENLGLKDGQVQFIDRGPMAKLDLAGHTTSPTTVDWDGDGQRALLIGAEDGYFYYLPR